MRIRIRIRNPEKESYLLGLEPFHCVLLDEAVGEADMSDLAAPVRHVQAGATQHHVEVHAVDADAGVVPAQ